MDRLKGGSVVLILKTIFYVFKHKRKLRKTEKKNTEFPFGFFFLNKKKIQKPHFFFKR